jgi:hypothetical protein
MVDRGGLEPPTSAMRTQRSCQLQLTAQNGGDDQSRTGQGLLAKQLPNRLASSP